MDLLFIFISVIVPVVIYFALPWAIGRYSKTPMGQARRYWLILAGVMYTVSWYLPSPLIQGQDTQFVTHFVGGGIFTALIWQYLRQALRLRAHWALELFFAYSLVSALGVANELFELLLTQMHIVNIPTTDTWWDLLANTSGLACGWVILKFVLKAK